MMCGFYTSCFFQGDNFSPKRAENNLKIKLSDKNEVGDIDNIGRYRDKPIPYGAATLEPPSEYKDFDGFIWMINTLNPSLIKTFQDYGADDIELHLLYIYEGQCNLAFSPDELTKISQLNIDFTISCDTIEEDPC